VNAEGLDEFVHPAGTHSGEVAVGHNGDQRGLGALASFHEPLWEIGALAELRDRNIDGADAGVEVAVPVAVALRDTVGAGFAPFGTDDGVCVGGQQGVDHGLQEISHQIWRRVAEGFRKYGLRVDNMWSGHRSDVLSRILWKVDSKDHTVTASTSMTGRPPARLHHYTGHYLWTVRESYGLRAEQ